jgi:antitoxin VapB
MTTKIFRSGNSLAMRIPASIRLVSEGTEVEIEEKEDYIRIRPAVKSLNNVMKKFAAFDKGFMMNGREKGKEPDRKW